MIPHRSNAVGSARPDHFWLIRFRRGRRRQTPVHDPRVFLDCLHRRLLDYIIGVVEGAWESGNLRVFLSEIHCLTARTPERRSARTTEIPNDESRKTELPARRNTRRATPERRRSVTSVVSVVSPASFIACVVRQFRRLAVPPYGSSALRQSRRSEAHQAKPLACLAH